MSTARSTTRSLDLLCLLDSYDTAHGTARASQRAGQWKIGTARREKGGFHLQSPSASSISALNVREELRARAFVVCSKDGCHDEEPALVDEGPSSATSTRESACKKTENSSDFFTLYPDGIPKEDADTGKDTVILSAAADITEKSTSTNSSDGGLRQRKKAPKNRPNNAGTGKKSEWSEETPLAALTEEELEEEKLRNANPLDLFGGLPPPSLRAAQVKAREALASYLQAANRAVEIIQIINEAEHTK